MDTNRNKNDDPNSEQIDDIYSDLINESAKVGVKTDFQIVSQIITGSLGKIGYCLIDYSIEVSRLKINQFGIHINLVVERQGYE